MSLSDLTIFVLQHIRTCAMNDSDAPSGWVAKARRVPASFDAASACFDADQLHEARALAAAAQARFALAEYEFKTFDAMKLGGKGRAATPQGA